MGGLGSWFGSWAKSAHDLDAEALQEQCDSLRADRIADVRDRAMVDVRGVLRSVTTPGGEDTCALTAEVYDGTGSLELVWLGRRAIRGIRPGALVRARGRAMCRNGRMGIFNPTYDLLPAHVD